MQVGAATLFVGERQLSDTMKLHRSESHHWRVGVFIQMLVIIDWLFGYNHVNCVAQRTCETDLTQELGSETCNYMRAQIGKT